MKKQAALQEAIVEVAAVVFSDSERNTYQALHDRYHEDRDLFSADERTRLLFARWLYRQGRIHP
jgi:hypothetical protein